MSSTKKVTGFEDEVIPISKNSLTVSFKDFNMEQLDVSVPVPGVAKTDDNVKFHTCSLSYRYYRGEDVNGKPIYESGPFKLTGPEDWMWDGVSTYEKEFDDKKTGLKVKRISKSIAFSIDLSNEEHEKFFECICNIYKRIVWCANRGPHSGTFKSNVERIDKHQLDEDEYEKISAIKPWSVCHHLLKVKSVNDSRGRPILDRSYKPRFYSPYVESGKRKTRIAGLDESGENLRPIRKDLVETFAYKGTPCWIFNDWFIGAEPKIRHAVTSVYVVDVAPKSDTFDQKVDMEAERKRRQESGLSSLSSILSTMVKERNQDQGEIEEEEYSKSDKKNVTPPITTTMTTTTTSSGEDDNSLPSGGILA